MRLSWKARLAPSDCVIRLCRYLEMGLRSGRDWIACLEWVASDEPQRPLREKMKNFLEDCRLLGALPAIERAQRISTELEWIIFYELILQTHLNASQMSKCFQNVGQSLYALAQARKKQASLLGLPKLQAIFSIGLVCIVSLILPWLFPTLFPSFIQLGRWDLFVMGLVVILMGALIIFALCRLPERLYRPSLQLNIFLLFYSILIEGGTAPAGAWKQASERLSLEPRLRQKLLNATRSHETWEQSLLQIKATLPQPWPVILTGMMWCQKTGQGLAQFVRETALREMETNLLQWEDEIRKLSLVSLLPLGFFIVPGSLFLVIGPQFLLNGFVFGN